MYWASQLLYATLKSVKHDDDSCLRPANVFFVCVFFFFLLALVRFHRGRWCFRCKHTEMPRSLTGMFHCSTCWSGSFPKGLKAPSTGSFVSQLLQAKWIRLFKKKKKKKKSSTSWAQWTHKSRTNYMCKFVQICTWIRTAETAAQVTYFCRYETEMSIVMWGKGWTDDEQLPQDELQCPSEFCKTMKSLISTAIPGVTSDTWPQYHTLSLVWLVANTHTHTQTDMFSTHPYTGGPSTLFGKHSLFAIPCFFFFFLFFSDGRRE